LLYRGDGAVAGARDRVAAAERVHGVYAGAKWVAAVQGPLSITSV
jgi:hypothetical protein